MPYSYIEAVDITPKFIWVGHIAFSSSKNWSIYLVGLYTHVYKTEVAGIFPKLAILFLGWVDGICGSGQSGTVKMGVWKIQEWTYRHDVARVDNAGVD